MEDGTHGFLWELESCRSPEAKCATIGLFAPETPADAGLTQRSACKVIKTLGFKCERHSISVSFEAYKNPKQSLVGLSKACRAAKEKSTKGEAVIAQALDSDLVIININSTYTDASTAYAQHAK